MKSVSTESRGLKEGEDIDTNINVSLNTVDDTASNPAGASERRKTALINSEETIESLKVKCNENLESCVTSCVPLEDVYAYSLCVVECAQNCS